MRPDDRPEDIRREIAALDRECASAHARLAVLTQRITVVIAEKEGSLADVRDATTALRVCPQLFSRAEMRRLRARYIASERTWRELTNEARYLWGRVILLTEARQVATARHRRAYQRR